jgi:hypothetical protein
MVGHGDDPFVLFLCAPFFTHDYTYYTIKGDKKQGLLRDFLGGFGYNSKRILFSCILGGEIDFIT